MEPSRESDIPLRWRLQHSSRIGSATSRKRAATPAAGTASATGSSRQLISQPRTRVSNPENALNVIHLTLRS
jgi:hypothetical protein